MQNSPSNSQGSVAIHETVRFVAEISRFLPSPLNLTHPRIGSVFRIYSKILYAINGRGFLTPME